MLVTVQNGIFVVFWKLLNVVHVKMRNLSGAVRTRGVVFQTDPSQRSLCGKMTSCEHKTCYCHLVALSAIEVKNRGWKGITSQRRKTS